VDVKSLFFYLVRNMIVGKDSTVTDIDVEDGYVTILSDTTPSDFKYGLFDFNFNSSEEGYWRIKIGNNVVITFELSDKILHEQHRVKPLVVAENSIITIQFMTKVNGAFASASIGGVKLD